MSHADGGQATRAGAGYPERMGDEDEPIVLYRPVGRRELELIREAARASFEARGHKQLSWVEPLARG